MAARAKGTVTDLVTSRVAWVVVTRDMVGSLAEAMTKDMADNLADNLAETWEATLIRDMVVSLAVATTKDMVDNRAETWEAGMTKDLADSPVEAWVVVGEMIKALVDSLAEAWEAAEATIKDTVDNPVEAWEVGMIKDMVDSLAAWVVNNPAWVDSRVAAAASSTKNWTSSQPRKVCRKSTTPRSTNRSIIIFESMETLS